MPDGEGQPSLIPQRAGDQLKAAREAQGLDLTEVAARTRIPQRHLESIETGNYSALPSTTYATGFARAYARAVGVDDVALVNTVRGELAQTWNRPSQIHYEPDDPARVPSRGVMWLGIMVAVLAVLGAALWFGTALFRGGTSEPAPVPVAQPTSDTASVPVPAPTPAGGQVTLAATDEVWVRIYDAADKTLLMRTLAAGERYDVPADADRPMINVGRPDKLAITVNGSAVAPLGDGRVAIKDVPIDAQALLARGAPAPAATPSSSSPSPSPSATPRATPAPRASATPRGSPARRPADPTPRATATPGAPESLLPPSLGGRPNESR